MAEERVEDGLTKGLGLIPGRVDRFQKTELGNLKLPHIGFNKVNIPLNSRLFSGLEGHADFYFVHSFYLKQHTEVQTKATSRYGIEFLSAFEHNNVFATQFHPEKSQTNGLRLLKNFLNAEHA